jgi:hypothetical protein
VGLSFIAFGDVDNCYDISNVAINHLGLARMVSSNG